MGWRHRFYCTELERHLHRLRGFDKIMIEKCYVIYHIHDPIENFYLHGFSDSSFIGLCSVYLFKFSVKKWKCFCSLCHFEIVNSAFKESSNRTTFGVIRSIYFIRLNEYCILKFKRWIEYWKSLLLGRFTNWTRTD